MSPFEIAMLLCFGLSWPISIAKTLRTRTVSGKSPLFMTIIILGYLAGVLHKAFYAYDWVIFLYVLNMTMVGVDLVLYLRFSRRDKACESPDAAR
ncbi:MAG: hypothetical protein GX557_02280 [Chloroflexi bacterium]|nr:hypothetical protein [Chloroflexota bacterium]